MADNKKIHDFAVKYYKLYKNQNTIEREVEIGFAEHCFELGFIMDSGKKFIDTYTEEAFNTKTGLNKVIKDINDVNLLGSAVFSRWRYVTHWAGCASLLDDEYREWFIAAFDRLAAITQ